MEKKDKAISILWALKAAGIPVYKVENELHVGRSLLNKLLTGQAKNISDENFKKLEQYADSQLSGCGISMEIIQTGTFILNTCKQFDITVDQLVEGFKSWHNRMAGIGEAIKNQGPTTFTSVSKK